MKSNNQLDTSSKEFKDLVKLHRRNLFLDLEKETKSLLDFYKNDHRLINLLAMSLVGQGFFESAIKELEQGIKDCPDRALLLNSLGATYLKLENNEKGIIYFLEALEDNKEFSSDSSEYSISTLKSAAAAADLSESSLVLRTGTSSTGSWPIFAR